MVSELPILEIHIKYYNNSKKTEHVTKFLSCIVLCSA